MISKNMRILPVVLAAGLAMWAVSGRSAVAGERPFTARDLVTMDRISDPQVAPDGERLVFVRRTTDLEADRGRTDLWSIGIDGSGLEPLTTHEANDSSPRWQPDGEAVYFLSSRSGSSQIWRIAADGGEATAVTDLPLDVGNLVVSPDGRHLAFTLEVFPSCESLECTTARLAEREASPVTGRLYTKLFVRHWDTWKDGRRSHLFVVPAAGGPALDLMPGMDADVPSKPFGGAEEITFTPDGRGVVFTARDGAVGEPWSTDFDLWLVPIDASAPPRNLTPDNDAWDTQPVFSPDGGTLAWLAMERPTYESDRFRIVMRPWSGDAAPGGGTTRSLTQEWDRSVGGFFFAADGRTIYATAGDTGQVGLFAVDVDSGRPTPLVREGHVRSPAAAGERIVFGLDSFAGPVDLYSIAADGSDRRRLTAINAERLAGVAMGEYEQFSFAGWNGETVYGYVVKPAGFEPGHRYPLAFLIHGGPQGSFGNDFHYRWNPQTYAGAGYAAVMIDFHGSTGYGQAFTDSIGDDWGGKPLVDLQKGLAVALERYPWIDGNRACALGASYGGYMINWIAGRWSDRFRCLVDHDGVFDNRMMYYATEELWFPEWDHRGVPWENPDGYEKDNPANYVGEWKTPILVIQGGRDYRIPETQGLASFTAAQRQGIPSEFLFYPDENHWVLKPANSIEWHDTVLGWLDRWTAAE